VPNNVLDDVLDHTQPLTESRAAQRLLEQATTIRRSIAGLAGRLRYESAGELSANQTAVLGMLFRFGDLTPGAVASRMGRSPQSLTRVFQALELAGLLERRPDPADGRQTLLALTLDGREALGAEMRPRDRWLAASLTEQCTPAERDLLVIAAGLLERIAYLPADRPRPARAVDDE
jgi:DNA-binding MarR family transcriptional regulator